nr:heavy metal translocating P-type ATPase [uncultured Trichococcus sp.]
MSEKVKQVEWYLDELDCANCASKVETGIAKIEGILESNVNFMTKTLRIEIEEDQENDILPKVKQKLSVLEPDIHPTLKKSGAPIGTNGLPIVAVRSAEATSAEKLHDPHDHHGHEANAAEGHTHEHSHGHSHAHGEGDKDEIRKAVIRLVVGFGILLAAIFAPVNATVSLALYVTAYLVAGYDIVWSALLNIKNGQLFDENFLMTIATLSAFYIQEYPEAVAVMLFYQLGELFQDIAVDKSRRSIAELMDIRPDYANVKTTAGIEKVAPETVKIGDIILIRPGEKVPLDGKVVSGTSAVDTSALTGESVPRGVKVGDSILSGFINKNGVIEVAVEKPFAESTVVKILDLVQNASSRKAPTENFITKFARYYTPVVVIAAVLLAVLPPLLFPGESFNEWLYRASIFLVISCPCALVVSIPVGFFGGIGSASRKGILVKGSNFLEGLNDVKTVVMDKTGTLTEGKFAVTRIETAGELTEERLLELAAYAELHSSHPIADSIKEAYGKTIAEDRIATTNDIPGQGLQVFVDGQEILAGNAKLMEKFEIAHTSDPETGTVVHIAVDKQYAGYILIADAIKADAQATIAGLKARGIRTIMLTGDSRAVGEAVAKEIGIDEVHAELLPQDKVTKLEEVLASKRKGEKVIFVGDGINDTPVLARSDIGIAMGGLGSDAAIEAADIVIMDDQPSKILTAITVAEETRKIVWQNIIFAMAVKGLFLILGAFGVATMWEAVFADVGVTVLAVLNSIRILKK